MMKRKYLFGHLLIMALLVQGLAQNPTPTPSPIPQKEPGSQEEVVRITTNLVQIDVGVFDKDNNPVSDLKPEDFEIKEDDRPQKITNFSYISSAAIVKPSQVKRTMAMTL